jgi:hypothetical protein
MPLGHAEAEDEIALGDLGDGIAGQHHASGCQRHL